MIVPMKKAILIMRSKDATGMVKDLRALSLIHVEHKIKPQGKDISSLHEDLSRIEKVISILSEEQFQGERPTAPIKKIRDWRFAARYIIDLRSRLDQLEEFSKNILKGVKDWQEWGDFDPAKLNDLALRGITLKLYKIPQDNMRELPKGIIVKEIARYKKMVSCAIVWRGDIKIPFKEIDLPKMSLAKMKERLSLDMAAIGSIRDSLKKCVRYRERFLRIRHAFGQELEFHEALRGMEGSGELCYITGYIPHDTAGAITNMARSSRCGILINDPTDEDDVPTLVRNPRWISIIKPVFRLLEILPGYREFDTSALFLIFLAVFFGMLIGDAGYGLIFAGATFIVHKKFGKRLKDKSPIILLYAYSFFAIMWGVLTGTFFGQEWISGIVKPLLPALTNDKSVQTFCFFLGAFHLSIAHAWRAILKSPSLAALADIGWISILWGGFFLAKLLILGDAFPKFGAWLFIAGSAAVIFFSSPGRNIFKAVGTGLGTLLLSIVNSFTDVVSYIRLFAVGLAGVSIADAFNNMAAMIGFGSLFAGIASGFVLLLGHALNTALGPMSVLVHGVRLNVLEFSSHADIKWSGFAYKPLRKQEERVWMQTH